MQEGCPTYSVFGGVGNAGGELDGGAAGGRLHVRLETRHSLRVDVEDGDRVARSELGLQVPGHLVSLDGGVSTSGAAARGGTQTIWPSPMKP